MNFIHASLFSGIGGFDYAAELMGWQNLFHCEWNSFCQKVLAYHFPNSIAHHDITKTDFTIYRGRVDILTGGFPCQPYSVAGAQKGTADERHLWPEMLRAIREIQPSFVVGENVPGLVNWSGGLVFEQVQADLEAEGYEVTPFLLPASGVNAPHQRERIWFIAFNREYFIKNSNEDGRGGEQRKEKSNKRRQWNIGAGNNQSIPTNHAETGYASDTTGIRRKRDDRKRDDRKREVDIKRGNGRLALNKPYGNGGEKPITYTDNINWRSESQGRSEKTGTRRQSAGENSKSDGNTIGTGRKKQHVPGFAAKPGLGDRERYADAGNWADFPTQSPVCNGNDGLSARLDGITFPKWRDESIKAGGNAIVPKVALQIFKAISEYRKLYL